MKQETKQTTMNKEQKLFLIEIFYQNVKRETCYFKLEKTLLETVPTPPWTVYQSFEIIDSTDDVDIDYQYLI